MSNLGFKNFVRIQDENGKVYKHPIPAMMPVPLKTAKKPFEEPTNSSITPGKECYICGDEFKKGEPTVMANGEYKVHKECEHGSRK